MKVTKQAVEPLSVLLVDGDPAAAKTTAAVLSLLGFKVATAASGTEALAAVLAGPPDVVLLQLDMPGVDGFDLARRLGEAVGARPVRIVALTDSAEQADYRRATAEGFDGYFVKPADPTDLRRVLNRLADDLDRRGSVAA